ncbi:MAG: hypothetical protein ACR2NO_10075 [Chloroflexota bacterium]
MTASASPSPLPLAPLVPLDEGARSVLWGDLFEIAVKRGCLALLRERSLLPAGETALGEWRSTLVDQLHKHLVAQTGAVDTQERAVLASSLDHLLLVGWGLGWTVIREYLRRLDGERPELVGLYCALDLPDRGTAIPRDTEARAESFWQALGLTGRPDEAWTDRGGPANADFLLVLRAAGRHHVLCLEFSLHALPDADDFSEERAHLDELARFVRRLEARGVFTRLSAEVAGSGFTFSGSLVSHLAALTTRDKPLYKLCQASSYATQLLHLLERRGEPLAPVTVQAIAVTSADIEALSAQFGGADPRENLMVALGDAYRRLERTPEADGGALDREIEAVRSQILRSLPPALRDGFAETFTAPPEARQVDARLREAVPTFTNPAHQLPVAEALQWVEDDPDVAELLGGAPRERVAETLRGLRPGAATVTQRDLHGAALATGLDAAAHGKMTVIAAEGYPGIGKTTAVIDHLRRLGEREGFLFFYASPRMVINSEVSQKVAHGRDGRPTGTLALTTNSRLIRGAWPWWRARPRESSVGARRYVDSAVVADGGVGLRFPETSTLFLSPEEAQQIDEDHASSGFRKDTLEEREDVVRTRAAPAVLPTLAQAARGCLEENPTLDRLVLTAAVQGYRTNDRSESTVDRLSELFRERPELPRGLRERRTFAARIGTIVAMVDEIAGDGAGAPFVHALAAWLDREFIRPFADLGEASPFRVILVLADASLANETVLASYLQSSGRAPEKVIVSGSRGPRPFRLASGALRLAGRERPTLHVMADGFPAGRLDLDYHLRLSPLVRPTRVDGSTVNPRTAMLEQHGMARLRLAVEEIFAALAPLPPDQQVILFAQDKRFLRDIRNALARPELAVPDGEHVETHGLRLADSDIAVLDGSVSGAERRRLIAEEVRDSKRVFLMTSSGARGINFPRAAVLIAFVPTFAIESGFMEIAQLIYRGRGEARARQTGETWNGDVIDRRVVLLLQDFVLADEPIDNRQWLRRTIDLVSALVLLRATILTRITGDAGITGQRAAVVPVGRSGAEDSETSLAASVAALLHEGKVYLRDTVPAYLRVVVESALRDTFDAFRGLRWTGTPNDRSRLSIATPAVLQKVRQTVCTLTEPLLGGRGAGALPVQTYGLGPVWMERWDDVRSEEIFKFEGGSAAGRGRLDRLLLSCRTIARSRGLPGPLRRAGRDVESILQRPDDLSGISFVARKVVDTDRVWVCLPVDYVRLCAPPPGEDNVGRPFRLDDPEAWLETLVRIGWANANVSAHHPVLPHFDDGPFLAMIAQGDPTGTERAFDDRFFMASSELNLLNAILFVAERD